LLWGHQVHGRPSQYLLTIYHHQPSTGLQCYLLPVVPISGTTPHLEPPGGRILGQALLCRIPSLRSARRHARYRCTSPVRVHKKAIYGDCSGPSSKLQNLPRQQLQRTLGILSASAVALHQTSLGTRWLAPPIRSCGSPPIL
jgi:hypothetical protein